MALDAETQTRIENLISNHDVVLFMKGHRGAPQCGFSATVVGILDQFLPDYATVDVLQDGAVREGVKLFSEWPTVPQLYVKGEFVGGCDIIKELYETNELLDTLGVELEDVKPPAIAITTAAAEALKEAVTQSSPGSGELHLAIDAAYRPTLSLSAPVATDIEAESGEIRILLDRVSASRADGASIDVVDGPQGRGFQIDIPGAPKIDEISPQRLKQLMDSGEAFELLDVRTPEERAKASIAGSRLMTDVEAGRLESLSRETRLVFYCHHGGRSRAAAEHFAGLGFTSVHNVTGGIDAWACEIDVEIARY